MKHLFTIICICLFHGLVWAQPANDECEGAIDLGILPVPAACPNGVGGTITINSSNDNSTPGNPYIYQTACNPSVGNGEMVPQANDVWYSFTATGYNVTIMANVLFGIQNLNIGLYQGTCGALEGRGCATTNNGMVQLYVDQLVPGNTYYIQLSGGVGEYGDLYLMVNNNINCDNCMLLSSLTVNPPPVNGTYQPGQTVDFCYHIDEYAEVNTNWLHGVQLTFGPGWDVTTIVTQPAQSYDQQGTWGWYPNGITDAQGNPWPAGFYYDRFGAPLGGGTANDGNPGNNFGDHIPDNITGDQNPYSIPANIWNFCWSVQVTDVCVPGANLSVTINTSGDGESGSWSNNGCNNDPTYVFQAITTCCPPEIDLVAAGCDGNDGQVTATPVGNVSPYTYAWFDANNTLISTENNVPGSQTLSDLAPGTYSLQLTDANNCSQTVTFTIASSGTVQAPVLGSNSPLCQSETLLLTAQFVQDAQYFWTGPDSFTSDNQNPSVLNMQPAQAGIYSCYIVVGNCTSAVSTINVSLSPALDASFTVSPPVCIGQSHTITFTGNAPAGATFNWNFSGGNVNSGTGSGPYNVTWPAPGNYLVTLSVNANGCQGNSTGTAIVVPNPVPGFSISPNIVFENNPMVTITDGSIGATIWNYSISDGSSFSTPGFDYSFGGTATYYITQTVSNQYGCTAQTVQNIIVRPSSSIYIPNAFTPGNNDNTNNSWGVIANNISNFRVMVFSRWGEVIFSSYDQHEQWTGHKNYNRKELVKQDVYVYKVWYTDAQGNDQTIIGHVSVVR